MKLTSRIFIYSKTADAPNLVETAIKTVAKDSPSFFQDIIFIIEAGLIRKLSEHFPAEEEILQGKISRNVSVGLNQAAVRVNFTRYGPEDIFHVSALIRARVEQVFLLSFNSNPEIFGGVLFSHWSQEDPPVVPFIQTELILD